MITNRGLLRTAGWCAATAGSLFILVQLIHPEEDVENVTSTAWTVTHQLTLLMAILAIIGVIGIYLRQVREIGVLGLIGSTLFALNFLLITAYTFLEAFVLPELVDEAPGYVEDALAIPIGEKVAGDVGMLTAFGPAAAVTYLLGGLMFAIAVYRAAVLARWAAALLAAGTVATLLVPVLPHALDRMLAVPVGVALMGLGISLARDAHLNVIELGSGRRNAELEVTGTP